MYQEDLDSYKAGLMQPRLPRNVFEQSEPLEESRNQIGLEFYEEVLTILDQNGVPIDSSEYRVKSRKSANEKRWRRLAVHQDKPLEDIYGVRVVTPYEEAARAGAEILKRHYNSYGSLRWDWPQIPPYTKDRTGEKPSHSHPDYKALHLIVPFGEEFILHVGEVQLVTTDWHAVNELTRRTFERRQGRISKRR